MARTHNPAGVLGSRWPTVALAVASAAYLAGGLAKPLNMFDEGVVTVAAQRVLGGEVPYRDFWVLYAPAQFYSLSAVLHLLGPSLLATRLWDLALRTALVLAVYGVARTLLPGPVSLAPPLLTLIWLGSVNVPNYPMFPALACALVGIRLAYRHLETGRLTWLVAAGAAVGVAATYRHDVGAYAILAIAPFVAAGPVVGRPEQATGHAGRARAATSIASA